jgi:hypothetical protein
MNAPADPSRLPRIRVTVLGIWAVVAFMTPYATYARLPEELSVGQGIGRALLDIEWVRSLLWSGHVLTVLKWTAVLGCLAQLAAGRRRPWLMALVFLTVLALDAVTKSLTGYVNHAQIGPLIVLFLVTVFDDDASDARAAVWLVRLALVIPYTFIGLHRLFEGGLEIFLGDALPQYIAQNSAGYSYYGFTVGLRLIEVPQAAALLKAGFAVMTLFELLSVGALAWPRFRPVWLLAMTGFHLATLVTMNILFWENLLLILVAFGPAHLTTSRRPVRRIMRESRQREEESMPGSVHTPMRFAVMSASPYGALSTQELRRRTGQVPLPVLLDTSAPAAGPAPAAAPPTRRPHRSLVVSLAALSGLAVGLVAVRRVRRRWPGVGAIEATAVSSDGRVLGAVAT